MKVGDLVMSEEDWKSFLELLIDEGLFSYKEAASAVLSQLNPPQVGTGTTRIVKKNYPSRQAWKNVKAWFYEQEGVCEDCGTRLDLQTDHVIPKQLGGEDSLENFALRCRRCNVVKRPSHTKGGGKLPLTTAAALMWILLKERPSNYKTYEKMCRDYGMTMANIRFQEAWALAVWLHKEKKYQIVNEVGGQQ
tara:strand:- start:43 stop:618 length:576 start_codon:yes stop_codon:yes gene_type:complete